IIPIKRMDESEVDPLKIPLNPDGTMKMTADGDIDFSGEEKQGPLQEFPFTEKRVWNLGIALAARQLQLDLDHAKILKDKIVLHGPNSLTRTIPLDPAGFFYIDWSIRYSDLKGGRTPIYYGHLSELLMNDYVRTHKGEEPADKFKDKIVLIGSVATGNNVADEGATPLEARTRLVTKHLNIAR